MNYKIAILILNIFSFSIFSNSAHAQTDHNLHSNKTENAEIINLLKKMQSEIKALKESLQKQGMNMDMGKKDMDMGMGMMKKMKGMNMDMGKKDMGMMGMMKKMKGMNMDMGKKDMDMDMGMMKKMKGMNMGMMGMMGMMKKMKGMDMMGKMDMSSMGESALPGFPGASHIYHIGSSEFFLDHETHISLSLEQKTKLNKAKQKSKLHSLKLDREIEQAEQELWELTSAGTPDIKKIDSKIRSIEKLKADQRLAFIRAVGESAKLLTDKQVKVLIGEEKSSPAKDKEDDHSTHNNDQ